MITIWIGSVPSSKTLTRCRACPETQGHLVRYVKTNGSVGLRWQCSGCGDFKTFGDIRHSFLETFGARLSDLPICEDGSTASAPCVICGEIGTEWHHWAPSSIFSALPAWSDVGAYLCVTHHREWHDVMRAHGLRFPHELAAAS